jgi:hypothetical protein
MSNHVAEAERDANARILERYIESFSTSLSERGYCAPVVGQKRAMVACFARWMGRRRIAAYKIDEATVSAFLAHLSRRGSLIGNRRCTRSTLLPSRPMTRTEVRRICATLGGVLDRATARATKTATTHARTPERSTGPRSAEGKVRVSSDAYRSRQRQAVRESKTQVAEL